MNQVINGGNRNIQINGDGNIVSTGDSEEAPQPNNPNLIACPACGKGGIYRLADKCPRCQYSFEKERLRVLEENRRAREQGLHLLALMATGVVVAAFFGAAKFHWEWMKSLAFGVLVVLLLYTGILYLRVGLSILIRRWREKF